MCKLTKAKYQVIGNAPEFPSRGLPQRPSKVLRDDVQAVKYCCNKSAKTTETQNSITKLGSASSRYYNYY